MANQLNLARALWDQEAATFDDEADHGLRDPLTRQAWAERLRQWLPARPCRMLDIGCGTGSLSVLAAEMGHSVVGIDCSSGMLKMAEAKAQAHGVSVAFAQMDAAQPTFSEASPRFDVVMCRHVLWALPNFHEVLARWANLLSSNGTGRLVLIEGFWATGAGLHAQAIIDGLPPHLNDIAHVDLTPHEALWGKVVNDERYAITATRRWFHGSPERLSMINAGSSITPTENIARAFSHKPALLSIDDDGAVIHHNGNRPGHLYAIDEMLTANDVEIHPSTPDAPWFEWLVKRPVRVRYLRETNVVDSERLTDAAVEELRAQQNKY